MNKQKSRIIKWAKYRENIDTNESLHFSIINSDPNLKKMFEYINFNIEKSYESVGYKTKVKTNKNINLYKKNENEINNILIKIENNETYNSDENKKNNDDLNSHKYDKLLNDYFPEFLENDQIENIEDQETTDIKISNIKITESDDNDII